MREVVAAAGDCLRDMGVTDARPSAAAFDEREKLAG